MFYSQFGEDKILNEIFHGKTTGLCIEVGANNGIDDSTSYFFETIGWNCILVEPNPSLCHGIRQQRRAKLYECAASNKQEDATLFVVEGAVRSDGLSTISSRKDVHARIDSHGFTSTPVQVQTMRLDDILRDAKIDGTIDFISIDVEGHEEEVLEGFSVDSWKPTIILVEDNSNCEDRTVETYLRKSGYVRFLRTGVNDWYTHRSNRQLAGLRNVIRVRWMRFLIRVKNRLRRIPFLAVLRRFLRKAGS